MSDGPDRDIGRQTAPAAAKAEVCASKLQRQLAILAAAFLTIDFFAPAIMDRELPEILGAIVFGILTAQFGMLAVWSVVGPGRWLLRQIATTVLAALGWLAFSAGAGAIARDHFGMSEILFHLTALVPLVFLAIQLPLWIGRWLRGWRLVEASATDACDQRESRRFSLSDLLLITAVVAVALALARFCEEPADDIVVSLMFAAILSPASAFATLACLLSAFRSRTGRGGVLAIAGYALGLGLAFDVIAVTMLGAPPNPSQILGLPLWALIMLATIHGSLALVRNAGYVLLPISAKRVEG